MTTAITWDSVEEMPVIRPGEIHLWWQDLHAAGLRDQPLSDLLSTREQQRVRRFKVDRVGYEFTAARALLKVLLSGYLDRPPRDLAFRYGPLGKPSIETESGSEALCFNYTDAGGFALYAFAPNRELGVDLESLTRLVVYRRIIERRFAERESAALLSLPEEDQRRHFLACWTRKEGYGKALGLGIRYPFDCRELCEDCATSPLRVNDHVDGKVWDIHQLYPGSEFVAALVHPGGPHPRRYFRLDPLARLLDRAFTA